MQNNIVCLNNNATLNAFIEINSIDSPQPWCFNSLMTPVYFIVFILAGQFVLMNVVIAVLMNELEVI